LEKLQVHLNTTNIVDDFKSISGDPRLQELRSLQRCRLTDLFVHRTPLRLDEAGFEAVGKGMIDVFPALERCEGVEPNWYDLALKMWKLRKP